MDGSKIDTFWEDPPPGGMNHGSHGHGQHMPYERNLNFSTVAIEDSEYGFPKKKTVRDPLSHRIIEKRRRDRMNNCLADLARLLPPSSLRKGRGRIEKTEIVELAIKHLRHLQCHACPHSDNCEYSRIPTPRSNSSSHQKSSSMTGSSPSSSSSDGVPGSGGSPEEHFRIGFQESMSETMHFLVEQEGMYAGDDICVRLVKHLNNHCDALLQNYIGNKRKMNLGFSGVNQRSASMGKKPEEGSLSSGYQPNGSSGSGSSEEQEIFRDGYGSSSFAGKSYSQVGQNMTSMSGGGNQDSLATVTNFDYDGDQNSCSSAQLSIEISDAYSQDGKMGRPQIKPPIPAIIGSHSSSNNRDVSNVCVGSSGSPPVNSSNSDEGNSTITSASSPSNHRYKFKNRIKQRFTEDLQTGSRHEGNGDRRKGCQSRQSQYEGGDGLDSGAEPRSPQPSGNETDNPGDNFDEIDRRSSVACDSLQGKRTKENNVQVEKRKDSIDSRKILSEDEATFGDKCPGTSLTRAESPVEQKPTVEELLMPPTRTNNTSFTPLPITVANMAMGSCGSLKEAKALAVCGPTEVPAFALHDKGLFYIPLTIDKSIVAPFIKSIEPNTQPPLHPVTISVCFLLSPNDEKKIVVAPTTKQLGATSTSSLPIHHAAATSPSIFDPSDVHHPPPVEIVREPNNFIMNRFAQSQVPMIFGSPAPTTKEPSNYGPCKAETITPALRYPFSLGGSSHGGGSATSDPSAKLYHHIENRVGPGGGSSGGSGYFASCGSSSSTSVGADSAHLPLNVAGSSSSSSSGLRGNSRKRSISSSSPSLGYHSWNDKSGSEPEAYIHGPPLPPPSVTAAAGIPGVGISKSTPLEVIDEVRRPGRRSSFGSHPPHKVHPTVTLYPGDQLSPDRDAVRASRDGKSTFPAKRSRKGRGDDGGSGSSSGTGSSFRQSVSSI